MNDPWAEEEARYLRPDDDYEIAEGEIGVKVYSTLSLDDAYAKASTYREKGFAVQLLYEKLETAGRVVYSVDAIPLDAGKAPIAVGNA